MVADMKNMADAHGVLRPDLLCISRADGKPKCPQFTVANFTGGDVF